MTGLQDDTALTCSQISSTDLNCHTAGNMFSECNIHNLWRSLERFKWWHKVQGIRELQYGFWNLPFKIHLRINCLMLLLPVIKQVINTCGYWVVGQISWDSPFPVVHPDLHGWNSQVLLFHSWNIFSISDMFLLVTWHLRFLRRQ